MKFDIALSFAGPQRHIARDLAKRLQAKHLQIFFDELFEHEMLGKDGADYLNNVFFRESRYCVALVSRDYERAAWAQLERRAAQAQELSRPHGTLIPVLVDEHRPSWLLPTRIYFDLSARTMDELAETLIRKINAHSGGQYRVAAELQDIYGDESHLSVASIGDEQFVLWSDRNHHRNLVIASMNGLNASLTPIGVDVDCEDITDVAWWNNVIWVFRESSG